MAVGRGWRRRRLLQLLELDFYATTPTPCVNGVLVGLNLHDMNLNGTIPSSVGSMTHLNQLGLAGNLLSGFIPNSLSSLTLLNYLFLNDNLLSGSIPSSMSTLTQLTDLRLKDSGLCGPVPMPHQPDDGPLPGCMRCTVQDATCYELARIFASTGGLLSWINRDGWEQATDLKVPVDYCTFHGLACSSGPLRALTSLDLSSNGLTGFFPRSFGSLLTLRRLMLHANTLNGTIPSSIGSLNTLEDLDLSQNALVGTLPQSFASISRLTSLLLAGNTLCGTVPGGFRRTKRTAT